MRCPLMESFFDATETIQREQSAARDYGAGGLLYHAEVSLLDAIDRNPGKSAAALADMLGITRSALTQTAKKLLEKGLITQHNPPGNRKTKHHTLTPVGEKARQGHRRFHDEANARMQAYLCGLPEADKAVLSGFFEVLRTCGQLCLYDCEGIGCAYSARPQDVTDGSVNTNAGT